MQFVRLDPNFGNGLSFGVLLNDLVKVELSDEQFNKVYPD